MLAFLEKVCYQLSHVFNHIPSQQDQKSYEVQTKKVIQFYQKVYLNDIRHKKNEDNFVRLMIAVMDDIINSLNYVVIGGMIGFFNCIWISYQTHDVKLWNTLKYCYQKWIW